VAESRPVEIRPAAEDDIPAIRSILAAHGNDGPVVVTDVVGPYLRHLLRFGRARVAVEGGEVVGFGATIDTGRSVHLADLFVRPDVQSGGIGRELLRAVLPTNAVVTCTLASSDSRARM